MTEPHTPTGSTPTDAARTGPRVAHVPERDRWEARVDGELAGFADAHERDGVVTFDHTLVEPRFEGRGVASALARASLADARARGLRVRPTCSFYARWIERHPAEADLLAEAAPGRAGS